VASPRRYLYGALILLGVVTVLKLVLSSLAGLGDSEALYAVYGLHPQGGYLDHPPLIGWIIRVTTSILGTSAVAVRLGPILLFPLTAMLLYDTTLRLSSSPRAAFLSVVILCATPVTFLGGLAATPDAPGALLWMLGAWLLVVHVTGDVPERRPVLHGALVGLVLGAGLLAKYTNALLLVAFVVYVIVHRRRWILTYLIPALVVAAVCALPVIVWNQTHGWSSLLHRLVWTQGEAGFSLRNVGALLGGQLLYVSPVIMVLVVLAMVRLWRDRREDGTSRLLCPLVWIPAIALWLLCLWSRVAEPHWPSVAYLPVIALLARAWVAPTSSARLRKLLHAGTITAGVFTGIGLVMASTSLATRLGLVEPTTDITNELHGWDAAAAKIVEVTPDDALIVGPHWTVCAQLEWALQGRRQVSCLSPEVDDYDTWLPVHPRDPDVYDRLHYVSDDRFRDRDAFVLTLSARLLSKVEVERGGKVVRTFRIYRR
jgi:hypothetical protein